MSLSALLFFVVSPARAELPLPVFPECGVPYEPDLCPDDLDEDWALISYIPEHATHSVREAELALGSGLSADLAWRTSTGRFDVTIAIGDSGIEWNNTNLVNKVRLQIGELPFPQYVDESGEVLEAEDHDLDGNGLVNISDYAEDPRVDITAGVDVADDILDPSDLIYSFSDGVDDDANGYVDDIAGWDFFGEDNDPWNTYDSGYGHHGSGVMEDAGAEGGDGGHIGVCPNCSILPLRVGDTFVVEGTRVGQAIAYATDNGVSVMGLAVGALSDPGLVRDAVEYAREEDMLIVAAAGDENSYHHNLPAMHGDILYVHSTHHDTASRHEDVYSYMNFFNCNNYGPRLDLVASSPACATGAVALISGASGLVRSAALDLGYSLNVSELRQVLLSTVDDVWLSDEELELAETYPSSEGWDPFYGYGRVNVGAAVDAVVAGEIPPVARFASPDWFVVLDPDRVDSLAVDFVVEADRASGFDYVLEWGMGWEPVSWTEVSSGSGSSRLEGRHDLDLGQLPLKEVETPYIAETVLERVERVHRPSVTLRLEVTDSEGRVAQARRTFFAYSDPDMLDGFPFDLGGSGESSPILADLDGDGVYEIVVATASGLIHVLRGDGTALEGWPASSNLLPGALEHEEAPGYAEGHLEIPREPMVATVAVGDLEGDGDPEVVAATWWGEVLAFDADGEGLDGFPVQILGREPWEFDATHTYENGIVGAPTLYDIDGDGALEILVAGMDSRIYAWRPDGSLVDGYPYDICHEDNCGSSGNRIITSITVGDVDGDGDVELGFGSNETVRGDAFSVTHLVDALTGEPLDGWPREESGLVNEAALLPLIGQGHPASLAFADVDGDGDLEIIDAIMLGQTGVIDHEGNVAIDLAYAADRYGNQTNSDEPSFVAMSNNPAFGDLDCDGVPDPIMGGAGTYALVGLALTHAIDFQHVLGAWSGSTGTFFSGWPRQVEDFQFLVAPAVADVSGDGWPEVIFASGGYLVHAADKDGDTPAGWPKFTGQWLLGSPAVGDIDGDGYLDVVVTTREGWLYAWSTAGHADQRVQWASLHHDPQNTGNYEVALATQIGPDLAQGCCKKKGAPAEGWMIAPLLLLASRRRRTRLQ